MNITPDEHNLLVTGAVKTNPLASPKKKSSPKDKAVQDKAQETLAYSQEIRSINRLGNISSRIRRLSGSFPFAKKTQEQGSTLFSEGREKRARTTSSESLQIPPSQRKQSTKIESPLTSQGQPERIEKKEKSFKPFKLFSTFSSKMSKKEKIQHLQNQKEIDLQEMTFRDGIWLDQPFNQKKLQEVSTFLGDIQGVIFLAPYETEEDQKALQVLSIDLD
ncbi:MAG: hypothetical protein K0S07_186, partial [Chlamydiales bacterium]|nr:hypothetical protein [Chlamydiales bacterium]